MAKPDSRGLDPAIHSVGISIGYAGGMDARLDGGA
jgi:hypothetical protein